MLTFEEEHMLASSKRLASFRVPAGVYEFPFTFPVPDCLLETITGAEHEYHSYQLQGVVERRVKRVVIVSQQIRIYRSPSFGSLDAFPWFPVIVEGFSDQNIQYQISLPSQNVPFGATFPVECWFAPHSEKTQARSLEIRLIEKHHLRFPATATESVRYNIHHVTSTSSHTIFAESFDLSDLESSHEIGWQVTKRMVLPRNFHHCTQSFFGRNIKIEHLLAITARFSGGNDQGAEIAETIPINVYMTPDSIGEDANVRSLDMRCSEGQASVPPPTVNIFRMPC
ncbi:hypothetical protein N7492_001799 [Penicillium capsulatum]|uniref:Arrestin C-terminal-like domain-containing protein n=1 Tax=Penicillium capsulatum TaxID=69766 RepID=A0A9W9IS64_9EURO|nr:hypothetical protein N7492_001799 [Penicillium capsulatum]